MRRRCLAIGCETRRSEGQPCCASHWRLLPAENQRAIRSAGRSKAPEAGRVAVREAVRQLAEWEGRA